MGSIVLSDMLTGDLRRAVLETLTYSDIFEYPLRLDELHRYLPIRVGIEQLADMLDSMNAQVKQKNGFFFLTGRDEIVELRRQRQELSQRLFVHALRYGRILGALPFVRMVAITGSLAVMNASKNADIDYMLVMVPGGLWTGRAFAVTFGRVMRLFGHRICVNLLVSEHALTWQQHDLYCAREVCQMIPVTGMNLYQRLRTANNWTEALLPNAGLSAPDFGPLPDEDRPTIIQRLLELVLCGIFGRRLERWTMKFQLTRMSRQYGSSDETKFSLDVCQSNFHEHRRRTQKAFQSKLDAIEKEMAATFAGTSEVQTVKQ